MKLGSIVILEKEDYSLTTLRVSGNIIPVIGPYYMVRTLGRDMYGENFIRLEEIKNKPAHFDEGYVECAFATRLFREIISPDELNIKELYEFKREIHPARFISFYRKDLRL